MGAQERKKIHLGEFRSFTKEMKTTQGLDSLNEFSKQARGERFFQAEGRVCTKAQRHE